MLQSQMPPVFFTKHNHLLNNYAKMSKPHIVNVLKTRARNTVSCTLCYIFKPHNERLTKLKLKIWSKAQRESARRLNSDWGDSLGGSHSFHSEVTWPELQRLSIRRTRSVDLG